MRKDDSSNVEALDQALQGSAVVSREPEREALADREQWTALEGRLGLRRGAEKFRRSLAAERLGLGRGILSLHRGKRLGVSRTRWGLRAAQAVSIVVSVALLLFGVQYTGSARYAVTRTYTTRAGQSAVITLDDGTHVMMASQSTLRLVEFGKDHRTVMLDGEAYFDVAHAEGAPFTVHTGGVVAQVLGTAFLVRHYGSDRVVRVAVAAGRVGVTLPRQRTPSVLVASDVGEIEDSTITVHSVTNLDADAQWVGGRLVFTNVPVGEVLATLTRWYGYEFKYADSTIARQNVTVWLSTRSSATALATLERLLHVSLMVAGDTVTLTPKREGRGQGMTKTKSYDVWTPTREVGR